MAARASEQLYVITSIFNPFRFRSRARLYHTFAAQMKCAGVQVLTIECAFGQQPFELTEAGNPWNVQLRTSHILWEKERLINLAFAHLKHLIPDVQYVGWFDCDIQFASPTWVEDTIHALSHLAVIQPYSTAINLDPHDDPMWNCAGVFKFFLKARGYHQEPPMPTAYTFKGHPGLAWAARRDVLDKIGGLYDLCIAGSGDTVMANIFKGKWDAFLPTSPSVGMIASMKRYAAIAGPVVENKIGYVHGALLHHWHGKSEERGYEQRWRILSFHRFDPTTDLIEGANGLLQWAGNKPKLEDDLRMSLSSRNEDSIDL